MPPSAAEAYTVIPILPRGKEGYAAEMVHVPRDLAEMPAAAPKSQ